VQAGILGEICNWPGILVFLGEIWNYLGFVGFSGENCN
jgi:hypothetical protein